MTKGDVANNISGAQIRQVKPGMSLNEVLHILGRPYRYSALSGIHQFSCEHPKERLDAPVTNTTNIRSDIETLFADTFYCCEGNKQDLVNKGFTLEYTRPVEFYAYPMLWIHFDQQYRVAAVLQKSTTGWMIIVSTRFRQPMI